MSDENDDNTTTTDTQGGSNAGWTPPATQEELNAIIARRLGREREKFADYDDIKSKAARLDEIEAANMSELEKERARAEELAKKLAERDAADEKAKADREAAEALAKAAVEVGAAKKVDPALLRGTTREELEAHADALQRAFGARSSGYVPTAGTGDNAPQSQSLSSGRDRAKARSKN